MLPIKTKVNYWRYKYVLITKQSIHIKTQNVSIWSVKIEPVKYPLLYVKNLKVKQMIMTQN